MRQLNPSFLLRTAAAALAGALAGALAIALAIPVLAETDGATPAMQVLAKQVTIRRTEYGVPHIIADNYRAAGFGFGYAQAEDHLHNIAKLMLTVRGDLSKTFGPGEKDANVESDFKNLRYRYAARAKATYPQLDAKLREMIEGFAGGLNYYIAEHRDSLEDWIQPVTPEDIHAHCLAGVGRFAFDRGNLVKKFTDKMEKIDDAIIEPEEESTGSNLWAFDGTRTKSGKAILMGNPHQPWSPVSTYYEGHVTIRGKYNMYGSTYIGRPILTSGFNDTLGWTHTVNYPDLEEIYALDLEPKSKDHYLFDGKTVAMTREEYQIPVLDPGNGQYTAQTREYWSTPLGPVVHRNATQIFVLKSVTWDQFRAFEQWLDLGHAKNLAEFRAAYDEPRIPMFNVGYADNNGNILYLFGGTVPKLPHDNHEAQAVHARGKKDVWQETHATAELPQLVNPKGGYVMNSNSPPYFATLQAPIDRAEYPRYFNDNALSLRSQHSLMLVNNDTKFSLEDVVKLKHDQKAVLADRVREDLLRIVNATEPQGDLAIAAEVVAKWDGTTARESRGGVLFEYWWGLYAKDHDSRADPYGAQLFAQPWTESDPIGTPRGIKDENKALELFKRAVWEVESRYGTLDVAWGEAHRLRLEDGTDLPIGGSGNPMGAFRILEYKDAKDGKRVANSGDSWVFAVEFDEQPRAYSVVAYGESEYAKSPHMGDQAKLFANEEMKPVRFSEADIKSNAVASYRPGEEKSEEHEKTD